MSWWAIHSAVGLLVTLSDISRRRWCLRMTRTNSNLKPIVGTISKSIAAMPAAWSWRKVFQVCDRPRPLFAMYLATVDWSDFDTELQQLAVDARRTPKPVRQAHLSDQAADLRWYPWPSAAERAYLRRSPRSLALHGERRKDEQQQACYRHQQPQQVSPTLRPRAFDMGHGASFPNPTLGG